MSKKNANRCRLLFPFARENTCKYVHIKNVHHTYGLNVFLPHHSSGWFFSHISQNQVLKKCSIDPCRLKEYLTHFFPFSYASIYSPVLRHFHITLVFKWNSKLYAKIYGCFFLASVIALHACILYVEEKNAIRKKILRHTHTKSHYNKMYGTNSFDIQLIWNIKRIKGNKLLK